MVVGIQDVQNNKIIAPCVSCIKTVSGGYVISWDFGQHAYSELCLYLLITLGTRISLHFIALQFLGKIIFNDILNGVQAGAGVGAGTVAGLLLSAQMRYFSAPSCV
ncbi:conserved hypothetical protein [Ricinus communis]|uniref:Uncharacterized protein n=1 Tax=Ricinus communis TaxID=3988 RepID=B9RBM0_RICCO|nr:conserved hypothetical protein [Ricinus communis]